MNFLSVAWVHQKYFYSPVSKKCLVPGQGGTEDKRTNHEAPRLHL